MMKNDNRMSFGEVCSEVKLSSKDPIADGFDKYIGLEHIDSNSLKLKRWGYIEQDNPSFTRVFKKGQILFGKRRPYLKKAAIAEFDGICSGDIIVMEPKKEHILPDLLPFIVQSNEFWQWAVKTSSGSLSPRTKFKALAEYQLTLPDLLKQKDLLKEIKMSNSVVKLADEVEDELHKLLDATYWNIFNKKLGVSDLPRFPTKITANVPILELKDVLTIKPQNGLFVRKGVVHENECLFLNVVDGYINSYQNKDTREKITCTTDELEKYRLVNGDLLFNRSSLVKAGIGWPFLVNDEENISTFDCHIIRVKLDIKVILPDYAYIYALSPWARKYFLCVGQTTTMTTISQGNLEGLPIPLPDLEVQEQIVKVFKSIFMSSGDIENHKTSTMSLSSRYVSKQLGM